MDSKGILVYDDTWESIMIAGTDEEFQDRLKQLEKIWEESYVVGL